MTSTNNRRRKQTTVHLPPEPSKAVAVMAPQNYNVLDALAKAATDPSVDVDKMERMLTMWRTIRADEAEREFSMAKNRLQPLLPVIKKNGMIEFMDKQNKQRNTPYALREDIEKAIRPLYTAEGFSTEFNTEYVDGRIVGVLILRHSGGHKEEYRTPPMPLDTTGSKNNNQAAGSTIEYQRRYLTTGAFNIITEGLDDDGKEGGQPEGKKDKFAERVNQQQHRAEITPEQAATAHKEQADPLAPLNDAAAKLDERMRAVDSKASRGELLMKNVKLLGALEEAGLDETAVALRQLAEEGIDG